MDVGGFLETVQRHPLYDGQLAHVEELPAREGQFSEPSGPLHDSLLRLLRQRGIEQLYSHQVSALEVASAGRDLVVVTGTASGKTLCYNLPILHQCLTEPDARALYLFPTKALAQDQLKGLLDLVAGDQDVQQRIKPGVFDGDTPTAQRRRIKAEANLVLSNPDMLHASILPYHPKWSRFFSELRYVVLDEVHMYRGILGAHVSCVLRRLMRVCAHYGADPVFLCASATIANPGELASRLLGRPVEVIDNDGSPRGSKYFALWNPAPLDKDSLARRQATDDAAWLMVEAMEAGAQALTFTRTRQAAELVNRYVQDRLHDRRSPMVDKMRAYRGGYLPKERRQIEQDLFSGKLRGVATTNALELGVDIGSLDVALLVNYPGTIASTWQQAGRSGRRHEESLAILLAGNDPVDQYLLRHPGYFFAQSPEHAVVDPQNPYVLAKHLTAAAFELPLSDQESELFGDTAPAITDILCDAHDLNRIDGKAYFAGGQNPAHRISLRHMSDDTYSIVLCQSKTTATSEARGVKVYGDYDPLQSRSSSAEQRGTELVPLERPRERNKFRSTISSQPRGEMDLGIGRRDMQREHQVIANVDAISAPELIYPEAVYLHNGETYFIRSLDLDGRVAYAQRQEMDYYTQAVLESHVKILDDRDSSQAAGLAQLTYGDVDVTWQTVMFKKIKFHTRENVGYGQVDLPAQSLVTTAFWLVPSNEVRARMKQLRRRTSEGLCGLRNLAVQALPMIAMCDSRDISGVVESKNLGESTLILYDRYPGGLGYCEKGFHRIAQLLQLCQEMVSECECEEGCPSCVGLPNLRPAIHSDPDLSRGYPIPDKAATEQLLELLLVSDIDASRSDPTHPHFATPCSARLFMKVQLAPNGRLASMLSSQVRARLEELNRRPLTSSGVGRADREHKNRGHSVRDEHEPPSVLDGRVISNSRGQHLLLQQPIDATWPAGAAWLRCQMSRWHDFGHLGEDSHLELDALQRSFPESAMFLDLETCGFAGSMVFLAGLVHAQAEGLVLSQLWARNYAEEAALLTTLWQITSRQRVLVTFNGKSFDWPQVHDRSTLHHLGQDSRDRAANSPKIQPPSSRGTSGSSLPAELRPTDERPQLVHCDLLHHSRRRWKRSLPNCRLQTLERFICGRRRTGDIPGRDIPQAYHDYVRTGATHLVRNILHHNALDLITLLQVAIRVIQSDRADRTARSA